MVNTPQSLLLRCGMESTMTSGQGSLYVYDPPLLAKNPVVSSKESSSILANLAPSLESALICFSSLRHS